MEAVRPPLSVADPGYRSLVMTHTNTEALSDDLGQYLAMHQAAIDAYEAATPADYRYSATALRKAVDAAVALSRRSANSAVGDGWTVGIDSAPVACTLLATYFDEEVGEWIVKIFVAEKPAAPFTHWQFITSPRSPWLSSLHPTGEAEPVAWRWRPVRFEHWEAWSWLKVQPDWLMSSPDFVVQPLYTRPATPVSAEVTDEKALQAAVCDALLNAFPMADKIADNYAAVAARAALSSINGGRENG